MRRLISTAFYLFRYGILSATLIVIGGFLMATFAAGGGAGEPIRQPMAAGMVLAALLLPALLMPRTAKARRRTASRKRKKPAPRPRPRSKPSPVSCPRDGHAFEQWVADKMETHGWRVDVTAGSGDQGLDIIARRDGRKIGVQCKRYDGAVGNKAVQEAFSGRAFHRVDAAVVITTGHYTPSAKALSRKTGVHLLHVKDIPRMRRLV